MSPHDHPLEASPLDQPDWPPHGEREYPILACLALDEPGRHALRHALYLSATHGHAPLHAAHVVSDDDPSGRRAVTERHRLALERAAVDLTAFVHEFAGD